MANTDTVFGKAYFPAFETSLRDVWFSWCLPKWPLGVSAVSYVSVILCLFYCFVLSALQFLGDLLYARDWSSFHKNRGEPIRHEVFRVTSGFLQPDTICLFIFQTQSPRLVSQHWLSTLKYRCYFNATLNVSLILIFTYFDRFLKCIIGKHFPLIQ